MRDRSGPRAPTGAPGTERVGHEPLHELVREIFAAAGLASEDAETVAEHLVQADLRGVSSHGVVRTGIYVSRIRRGLVEPRPRIAELTATPVSALLDGGNGPGIVVASAAMRTATTKATQSGIGAVSVRGSNHCGMLAYYTAMASARGLIGFATTSAPPTMAPWGGTQPFFGTNPLSYAVPTPADQPDVVFDMATSNVARGKIVLAHKAGEPIPLGWALSSDGEPTGDPATALAGSMLPLGEHKGSGLAMLVDILSGVLSGANYGPHIPQLYEVDSREEQNVGHFFLALRPDLFLPLAEFNERAATMADELRALPTAQEHARVLLPGEPEAEREADHRQHGIPLTPAVRQELAQVAADLGAASGRTDFLGVPDPRAHPLEEEEAG
ncbi:LDH2 family malate/lactate/ureidoglycolate dehydrogenase [Lipingzhangella halophila]|uniref:LDH2 family malate/lactate/ureidoglycolate dehydrogenase n=1 Tax=Lipingzhangella halophila TaxID=1783352 RepID=A0A7W7RJZ3_9ACTN|nr:Ldh family oxidoreductase [Lipingzhangella halophila]MBB4933354.1 LDH2 family malate/lactate/ureidoglycolate dehydrogenase [Lipingzhangella halophila]